jgi:zinc/manganese transport system substrate-binding protein
MKRAAFFLACLLGLAVFGLQAQAQIYVVTTDPTLADLARSVGGDKVRVESLSRGTDDPHQVEPRPSMVVKVSRAQVFARIGMDLDMWADGILDKAGNRNVIRGGKGYADCSVGIRPLEVPTTRLDPSMGDIHVYGNPHYLLDPANGIIAAGNIAAALIRVDPANRDYYAQRHQAFGRDLLNALNRWRGMLAPYRGAQVVVYHKSWTYFMARFGLKEFGSIEPKPGIPPSPGHVNDLVRNMKSAGVRVMLMENFRARRFPDMIERQTGAKAVFVPGAVEAEPGIDSYIKLFDTIVNRLSAALK